MAATLVGATAVSAAVLTGPTIGSINSGVEAVFSASTSLMAGLADALPVGYAFGAGMVAALNPCGFARRAAIEVEGGTHPLPIGGIVKACQLDDLEGCMNIGDVGMRTAEFVAARAAFARACQLGSGSGCVRGAVSAPACGRAGAGRSCSSTETR